MDLQDRYALGVVQDALDSLRNLQANDSRAQNHIDRARFALEDAKSELERKAR
jgi:hypothetical protein